MPEVVGHEPGSFCFLESGTKDAAPSIAFYRSLFGWQPEHRPFEDGGSYTRFLKHGTPVAGMYEVAPEHADADIPLQWLAYVTVTDAIHTLERAVDLGAARFGDVVEVPGVVTVAEFVDPVGAICGLWQPASHIGTGYVGESGALTWTDLATVDLDGASAFYGELFGWTTTASPTPTYRVFSRNGITLGGLTTDGVDRSRRARWRTHVGVDDLERAVALAVDLGGTVRGRPARVPHVGRHQEIADPHGIGFSLIELTASGVAGSP